jgi:hypothetical protein
MNNNDKWVDIYLLLYNKVCVILRNNNGKWEVNYFLLYKT